MNVGRALDASSADAAALAGAEFETPPTALAPLTAALIAARERDALLVVSSARQGGLT